MRIRSIGFLTCGLLLFGHSAVQASFVIDTNPGGDKFFIDKPKDPTTTFLGNVGGNNSGPIVDVLTNVNVTTGSGYANIKPDKDLTLTTLTFTPRDGSLFSDFSFRGQLEDAGDVTVKVQDNQGHLAQTFTFTIDKDNKDFKRIGIISLDGETIKFVTISNPSFNEVKQIDFSTHPGPAAVPEPATVVVALSGLIPLGIGGLRRVRRRPATPAI